MTGRTIVHEAPTSPTTLTPEAALPDFRLLWHRLTPAEQITLPTYPSLAIVAGLLYMLQSDTRLSGPAFQSAKQCWSMDTWGLIFMSVGACQATALMLGKMYGSRWVYVQTLYAGVALTAFWTVLLFRSAQASPFVSYTAGLWLLGLTVLQIASTRSLRRR